MRTGEGSVGDVKGMIEKLELVRLELENLIAGKEIRKEALPESWSKGEEKELALLMRIADILDRIEPVHVKGEI